MADIFNQTPSRLLYGTHRGSHGVITIPTQISTPAKWIGATWN